MPESQATSAKRTKAVNAGKAMLELQKTNPTLHKQINDEFFNSGLRYTAKLKQLVASAPNASIRGRLNTFFSDTGAYNYLFESLESDLIGAFGVVGTGANIVGNLPQKTLGNVAEGLHKTFSNPFSALFQANIWLRVGEVALGIILIAVGVARLTNAVPIATKIARYVK